MILCECKSQVDGYTSVLGVWASLKLFILVVSEQNRKHYDLLAAFNPKLP